MRPKPAPAYLELPRPQMSGGIVDERAREVALYTTNEVVVLRMCAFTRTGRPAAALALRSVRDENGDTHEMIPNAWYSIIEERDIRARRPCCIPRSKRRMATFGDGCSGGVEEDRGTVSRTRARREPGLDQDEGTHHFDVHFDLSHGEPWDEDAGAIRRSVSKSVCAVPER